MIQKFKARMFVVDENTIVKTKNNKMVSIVVPKLDGAKWDITVTDLIADMLQIEIGDYIFLWEMSSNKEKSKIHGVYRAISKPFYQCSNPNDRMPLKIHIEVAYDFKKPVEEYDVLNSPYIKHNLWNIVGKKVKGKARGTSPLSMEETRVLTMLLMEKNPKFKFYPYSGNVVTVNNPLKIDYLNFGKNQRPDSLNSFHPNNLYFFKDEKKNVRSEKVLEAILNQEMSNRNAEVFSQIGIDVNKVIWYSNYLPYSIEQSEMDYVIVESEDGRIPSRVYVIELMTGYLDESHVQRVLLYSKWVNETLLMKTNIVQPIIICKTSVNFDGEKAPTKVEKLNRLKNIIKPFENNNKMKPLRVYTYDFTNNEVKFNKKR